MDAGNTKTAERGEKIIGKERYRKYGNEETGRAGKTEEKENLIRNDCRKKFSYDLNGHRRTFFVCLQVAEIIGF